MIISPLQHRLRRIFAPTYDELTLFAISFTCVLFFLTQFPSSGQAHTDTEPLRLESALLILVIGTGIALSLYHAFSKRRKSLLEKQLMFVFACIVNSFTGIWSATYLLSRSEKWTWVLVFPVINLISSWWLVGHLRYRKLDETCIDDRNIALKEVALTGVIITIIFVLAQTYLLHWAATLSICVAYGTNLNKVIINWVLRTGDTRCNGKA